MLHSVHSCNSKKKQIGTHVLVKCYYHQKELSLNSVVLVWLKMKAMYQTYFQLRPRTTSIEPHSDYNGCLKVTLLQFVWLPQGQS